MDYQNRREFIKIIGLSTVSFMLPEINFCTEKLFNEKNKPNIIIVLTDDQGYSDLGCYGVKGFSTPNIDKLATQGMRFTDYYVSSAVCSASRASLLTGCYSERVSIQGALMPSATIGLNPEEDTIAKMLKKIGYATGIIGKWHLGHHKEFLPLQHGFDEYFGLPYSNDMWPVDYSGKPISDGKKSNYPVLPIMEGNEKTGEINTLEDQSTLTTKYTERAVKFIEKYKNEPFFLYLAHSMPHVPLAVSDKYKGKSRQGLYGDVIMEIDWSAGEIMKTLEKYNLDKNTILIFTSDNGPWLSFGNHAGSALPLREGKGTMWEGGPRVPFIIRWPEIIPAGKTCSKLASSIDVLPTIAQITNAPLPKNKIDGISMLPLFDQKSNRETRDILYFYYGGVLCGIRKGKWKLYFPHNSLSYKGMEPGKDGFPGKTKNVDVGLELYNLEEDIGETRNVVKDFPDIVTELMKIVDEARRELGDKNTKQKGEGVRPPGRFGIENSKFYKHLGINKSIKFQSNPSSAYPALNNNPLLDGFTGSLDYSDGFWQGFEEYDLEALIDLGSIIKINKILCNFLQNQSSWIFLPTQIDFYSSSDGIQYEFIKSFSEKIEADKRIIIQKYEAEVRKSNARYIKVIAKNPRRCPKWHTGSGGKTWIFIDEIIVK